MNLIKSKLLIASTYAAATTICLRILDFHQCQLSNTSIRHKWALVWDSNNLAISCIILSLCFIQVPNIMLALSLPLHRHSHHFQVSCHRNLFIRLEAHI